MVHHLLSLTLVVVQLMLAVVPLYRCHRGNESTSIMVGAGCPHATAEADPNAACCCAHGEQNSAADRQHQHSGLDDAASQPPCVDIPVAHALFARCDGEPLIEANCAAVAAPTTLIDARDVRAPIFADTAGRLSDDGGLYALATAVLRC